MRQIIVVMCTDQDALIKSMNSKMETKSSLDIRNESDIDAEKVYVLDLGWPMFKSQALKIPGKQEHLPGYVRFEPQIYNIMRRGNEQVSIYFDKECVIINKHKIIHYWRDLSIVAVICGLAGVYYGSKN